MRKNNANIQMTNAANLDVTISVDNIGSQERVTAAKLVVSIGTFTAASGGLDMTPSSLISRDTPNDLKVGSDNKLLSRPDDVDFLADYIMASN